MPEGTPLLRLRPIRQGNIFLVAFQDEFLALRLVPDSPISPECYGFTEPAKRVVAQPVNRVILAFNSAHA